MKNKRIFKTFSALCAALVLMMGLSVTAFAQGTDQPPAEDATNDANVVVRTEHISSSQSHSQLQKLKEFFCQLLIFRTKTDKHLFHVNSSNSSRSRPLSF